MKIKKVYKTYLIMTISFLVLFTIIFNGKKILLGYLIGIGISLIHIAFSFVKANAILADYDLFVGKKILLKNTMFLPLVIIFISLVAVYQTLGLYGFIACLIPLYLQKPALMYASKNWKGGVN